MTRTHHPQPNPRIVSSIKIRPLKMTCSPSTQLSGSAPAPTVLTVTQKHGRRSASTPGTAQLDLQETTVRSLLNQGLCVVRTGVWLRGHVIGPSFLLTILMITKLIHLAHLVSLFEVKLNITCYLVHYIALS